MATPHHRRIFLQTLLCVIVFVSGVAMGFAIATKRVFPFDHVKQFYKVIKYSVVTGREQHDTMASELPILVTSDDIRRLISLDSVDAVSRRRKALLSEFRGAVCLHDSRASKVEQVPQRDDSPSTLGQVLLVHLPHGFTSRVQFFKAPISNKQLVIYTTGHDGQSSRDLQVVDDLLRGGFDVAVHDLPLSGKKIQPVISIQNVGRVQITHHDQMRLLETADFNPLILFVEPIACLVNYFSRGAGYLRISQIGVSGGGFVSTLSAALDPRIANTYSVSGVYPAFLRFANPRTSSGDYEQVNRSFLDHGSDIDLYIMAAAGEGREYVQIFNEFDPCCYAGRRFQSYSGIVSAHVEELASGRFEAWLDVGNFEHLISTSAVQKILGRLNARGAQAK